MVFEHIEKLKEEYTDKYVTVDEARPELQRFGGLIGRVKTVNMSGRALVEFDEWINNIGWFDIDVDFLKVVDDADVEARAAASKAAPKKKAAKEPSKLEKTRESAGKPAAAPTAGGMSTADILAAARGGTVKAPAQKKEPPAEKKDAPAGGAGMSVQDMLAAARASAGGGAKAEKETPPAPAETQAKKEETPAAPAPKKTAGVDTSGMTVEQMLALAREQASGKAPKPAPETAETLEAPPAEPPAEPEPPVEDPAAETPAPAAGELPKDVDGIVAYCRQADG